VNSAGELLDRLNVKVSGIHNFEANPVMASDGSNFLVLWQTGRLRLNNCQEYPEECIPIKLVSDISGARLNSKGQLLDQKSFPVTFDRQDQSGVSVAWNGENFLSVWDGSAPTGISAAWINSAGVTRNQRAIPLYSSGHNEQAPTIIWNGSFFFLSWRSVHDDKARIEGIRLSKEGVPLDSSFITINDSRTKGDPAKVAWANSVFMVVWAEYVGNSGFDNIYGALLHFSE
jgi:hypothetical protein